MKLKTIFTFFAALALFTACESNQPKLNKQEVTLQSTEQFQLEYLNFEGEINYSTDNEYIADIDQKGLISAYIAGETFVYANDLACKVIVNPRYTYFLDPSTDWNASRTTIQDYMKDFDMEYDEENAIETYYPKTENQYVESYMYIYENEKMVSAAIGVYNEKMEEIAAHIMDRYIVINMDQQSGSVMFIDPTETTSAILMPISNEFSMFVYVPAEDESNAPKLIKNKFTNKTNNNYINLSKYFNVK